MALQKAVTEYGSVEFGDTPMSELVVPVLRQVKWLAPGRVAFEIQGKDSKGEFFRLSSEGDRVARDVRSDRSDFGLGVP